MYEHDDADALHAAPSRVPTPEASGPDVSRTADPGSTDARSMLELQRLAGNASVSRLLARGPSAEAQLEPDAGSGGSSRSPVLDVVGGGGGETLQPDLRAEMEGRLGADFGDVRIHRDGAASDSARSVGAHAYTVGSDVVFRSDRWDPSSSEGKRTLAHELTHVIQQSAGPVAGSPAPGGIRVSSPNDAFEQAADLRADAALSGPTGGITGSPGASNGPSAQLEDTVQGAWIQRQDDQDEEEVVQGAWVQRQEDDELPEEAEAAQAGPQASAESAASDVGAEAAGSSQAPVAGESAATNAAAQAAGANQAPVAGESAATNAAAQAASPGQAPGAEDLLEESQSAAAAGATEGLGPPEEAEDEEAG